MTVLFLTPRLPFPLDTGTNFRNYRLIQAAATEQRVHLLSFLDRPATKDDLRAMDALCERVELVAAPRHSKLGRLRRAFSSSVPDLVWRRWSPPFADTLSQMVRTTGYDVVDIEGLEMAAYRAMRGSARLVYGAHNVEHLLQQRVWEVDRNYPGRLPRALYSRHQARLLARLEAEVCATADRVTTVSAVDRDRLMALAPNARSVVIPNTIDVELFPARGADPDIPTLVFTGTLDYRPNIDAVTWLTDEIVPAIRANHPAVRLFVVGRAPATEIVARGQRDPSVAVTGAVKSVQPYFDRATIYVLPMRSGGGVRFKALEAMAASLPVVSTAMGMDGVDAQAGRHYLAGDSVDTFARNVSALLDDPIRRRELAAAGRELVAAKYDWRAVASTVTGMFRELTCGAA
ncbi:MAG: glycosyltransferase family 4 protein [Chloroflexota bacterium]